ncbi:MAG: tetratricopeptide repeat protein [Alphaproteobacteria bacterium]|nr:tetratricopeptide repeat protein [Alphaproteobacteria bacterium]
MTRLDRLETQVGAAEERLSSIDADIRNRTGFIGSLEAMRRYEDAVFNYLLGRYDEAAKEFFTLLESGVLGNSPEFKDSQWYLAECLFELRNFALAEDAYQVMVNAGPQHPFFPDAVRRLLEIYGITGDGQAFYDVYNSYIITSRVEPSDVVKYTLAKSFYRQGEYARAKSMLEDVQLGGTYYSRARYLLGTVLVVEGNYDDAIDQFKLVSDLQPNTVEDREVVDLANLALGRLYYELGDFTASLDHYQRISRASQYFPDALYEMGWTSIKQEDYQQALQSVEIFLLAYPEHRYTAQLKLDQGHLYRKESRNDDALNSYQSIVDEYTPITEQIRDIEGDPAALRDWFGRLSAADGLDSFYGGTLPVFAIEMLLADQEVSRALRVYRELRRQRTEIDESKQLIQEIEAALDSGTVGTFQRGNVELSSIDLEIARLQGELLYLEESWLLSETSGETADRIRALRKEREDVAREAGEAAAEGREGSGPEAQITAYAELRKKLQLLRSKATSTDARQVANRIDAMWDRLARVSSGAASLESSLGGLEAGELGTIRARLEAEKVVVSETDAQVSTYMVEAEALSTDVTRAGFNTLGDTFAESILRADKGIVDVYWSEKIRVSEERRAVLEDQKALLSELDQQFRVIRQNLPAETTDTKE